MLVACFMVAFACEPNGPENDMPNDPIENPDNQPKPDPDPDPDPEPEPDPDPEPDPEPDPDPNPEPEPEPEPEATVLAHLSGIYFGNEYGATENDYNYSLALATHGNCYDMISGDVIINPNSQYLFLDLYSSTPAEEYNIRFDVPVGEYIIDKRDSFRSGTISVKYSSLYTTNETTGTELHFASGNVSVTEDGITARLITTTNEELCFSCPTRSVDNSQNFGPSFIPAEQSTLEGDLEIEFSECSIILLNFDDYYVVGKNNWLLNIMDDATGDCLTFELLAPMDDTLPIGIFPVSNDLNNKQMALPGYVDASDTVWSWYLFYSDYTTVTSSAPIVDGEIEIIDNNDDTLTVVIDVVDDIENRITGTATATYSGVSRGATRHSRK